MATPIGHALFGATIGSFVEPERIHSRTRNEAMLLAGLVATIPDFDVIPGLVVGQPILYHSGISHSLGFALLISLLIATICHIRNRSFVGIFVLCLLAYSSHLMLDFFATDGRAPYGIPIAWPLIQDHFISPIPLLPGVRHASFSSASTQTFISGLLTVRNVKTVAIEVGMALVLFLLGTLFSNRRQIVSITNQES